MSVAPDLLLQTIPDLKLKATPARAPERTAQPSQDEASSFSRVYQRERQERAGSTERSQPKGREQADEPAESKDAVVATDDAEVSEVAADGNGLPVEGDAEASSSEADETPVETDEADELLLFALLPSGPLPEQAKGQAVGLTGELPEQAAEPAQLQAAVSRQPGARLTSAAPATLTEASSDPQVELLNSLADVQLPLEGEARKAGVTAGSAQAPASQPAALFGQAMAALQAQAEGASAESDEGDSALLEEALANVDSPTARKPEVQAEALTNRLTTLAQVIAQQTGRSSVPQVPGQPMSVHSAGMSEALVDRVMWLSSQNLKSAEIQLDPAELGRLEVRIELTKDQAAQVTFASPNAAVRDALEGQQHRLRELFAQQGMGQLDVNVSDQSLNRGAHGQTAENDSRGRRTAGDDSAADSLAVQGQLEIRSRPGMAGSGLVDYYA